MSPVIRTAVVGFGTSGKVFHGPLLAADPEFVVSGVVTSDAGRSREVTELHPEARLFADVDALFAAAEDFDLLVVGSPPVTHAGLAHRAIDAGLAVVVDKPFTTTSAEADAVIAHALEADVPLTVFQNRRLDADFLTLQRLIADGRLGEVRRFESRFEWWKPTLSKAWQAESTPADGGGILFDLGTHLIDQAIQLFGDVVDVRGELGTFRPGGRADDDAFVALRHESGVISHLTMSSVAALHGPRFHVLGSLAGYTKWGLDVQEGQLKAGLLPNDPGYGVEPRNTWGALGVQDEAESVAPVDGSYPLFYRRLADALLRGGDLPVQPSDARRVIELIEQIRAQPDGTHR